MHIIWRPLFFALCLSLFLSFFFSCMCKALFFLAIKNIIAVTSLPPKRQGNKGDKKNVRLSFIFTHRPCAIDSFFPFLEKCKSRISKRAHFNNNDRNVNFHVGAGTGGRVCGKLHNEFFTCVCAEQRARTFFFGFSFFPAPCFLF